jgi:hypothetical protein
MARRNWQNAFQHGEGLSAEMIAALESLEDDLEKANAGGGATTLAGLTDVTGTPGLNKSPVDDGSGVYPLTEITTRSDLDGILASVAAVEWHDVGKPGEPPFQSEFSNLGSPWSPARFRHTLNNTVYLQGTVTHPSDFDPQSTWLPIFQLPAELMPSGSIQFGCISNDNSMSKVVVWEDGAVIWGGYITGTFVANIPELSLGGISFSVGAAQP